MSAHERTGWRDLDLSNRHRLWGLDCPIVDVDFLVVEYDDCQPRAIIDYKNRNGAGAMVNVSVDHNLRTLKNLGDGYGNGIPVFVVRYRANPFVFWVFSINDKGHDCIDCQGQEFSEIHYVTWLYNLRGRLIPPSVLAQLQPMSAQEAIKQDRGAEYVMGKV